MPLEIRPVSVEEMMEHYNEAQARMPPLESYVQASDLAEYTFCPESTRLKSLGYRPNAEGARAMDRGRRDPRSRYRSRRRAPAWKVMAYFIFLAGLVAVFIWRLGL